MTYYSILERKGFRMRKIFDKKCILFVIATIILFLLEYGIFLMPRMTSGIPEVVTESISGIQMMVFGLLLLFIMLGLFSMFRFRKAEHTTLYVVLLVTLFGIIVAILSPVLNGFDEQAHFFKTVAFLDGKMFRYESYNYRISESYVLLRDHFMDRWYSPLFSEKWSQNRIFVEALENGYAQPTYPFYGYLFCAAGVWIARIIQLPAGMVFLAGRITNVIGYALLILTALKMLPEECERTKNAVIIVSCLPGSLFVASHYTQDGVAYGIILILIVLFFRMSVSGRTVKRDFILFSVLLLLLVPLKYPYILLGLLLFIIPKEKLAIKRRWLWIGLLAFTSVVVAALWFILVSSQYHEPRMENVNGIEQLKYMIIHLPYFLVQSADSFIQTIWSYFADNMRLFGGRRFYASESAGIVFGVVGLFLLFFASADREMKGIQRFVVGVIIILTIFATEAALYVSYNSVGSKGYIEGVQGRYFYGLLPLIPLLGSKRFSISALTEKSAFEISTITLTYVLLQLGWYLFGFSIFL